MLKEVGEKDEEREWGREEMGGEGRVSLRRDEERETMEKASKEWLAKGRKEERTRKEGVEKERERGRPEKR